MTMGELVKTLATGDNFSKVLMVIVLLISSGNWFKIGSQNEETRTEVDRQAAITRAQVRQIYTYQLYFLQAMKGLKTDHAKLLNQFGLGASEIPEPPIVTPMPFDGE